MTTTSRTTKSSRSRSTRRRRISGLLALAIGLLAAGGLYTVLTPTPQTAQAQNTAQANLVGDGEQLYNNQCITCHGANLEGVDGRGPSLIGVGEAAVYFQVSTGRMPLARQEAQAVRGPVRYEPEEIDALAAYVQEHGGGAERPSPQALTGGDPARGGEMFRLNCASCHNFTGRGGALSSGKSAPNLDEATPEQIYTAMESGPANMPKFSDGQLTPDEKADIIAYVQSVTNDNNSPGGLPLGGFGPVSEGFIAFVVGIGALVVVTVWIGAKQ